MIGGMQDQKIAPGYIKAARYVSIGPQGLLVTPSTPNPRSVHVLNRKPARVWGYDT